MLYVPSFQDYRWRLSTQSGVRPAAAYGTTVTPAQNSKGSYAELIDGALVTEDVWFIAINFNSNAVANNIRDTLVDVAIDPAAGTSYSIIINNLLMGGASPYDTQGGGVWYGFPLHIPAGSSIAVRGSVNNATVGTFRCFAHLYGRPRNPETTKKGYYVTSFGANTANSRGTIVTPGTTSEGAWTSLGTISDNLLWWWQVGSAAADSSWQNAAIHLDLAAGDGSNKKLLIEEATELRNTNEQQTAPMFIDLCGGDAQDDDGVYGRAQTSGSVDSSFSMMAYGVGS